MRPRPAAATWGAVLPGVGRGGVSKEALPTRVCLFCKGGEMGRRGTFQYSAGELLGVALLHLTSLSVPSP